MSSHEATISLAIPLQNELPIENTNPSLSFELEHVHPEFGYAKITVPSAIVDTLYHEAARSQQHNTLTQGFNRGKVPIEYIKQNFRENLTEHLEELLLKYCVLNFLYEQIRINKILISGSPRLSTITLEPKQDALFTFELTIFPDLPIHEWKYFPFRAPKRKNYKDIDRQVNGFVDEEKENMQKFNSKGLSLGDWVSFDLSFIDDQQNPLIPAVTQNFWFKLGEDETESPLQSIFFDKRTGDIFHSNHTSLQHFLCDQIDTTYMFSIKIVNMLSNNFFDFEQFKHTFRIKTNKDMNRKLIEVFSYRNDISQRHAMVDEALKILLSKHKFNVPNHIILRKQKSLLENIQNSPDYHVYRSQKNFQDYIRNLAKKQTIEMLFIDKLAYTENLSVNDDDIKGYLNLTHRPRMKDFIYFEMPSFKVQGQEVPIPCEEIKRTCLREKTINYIIYHLTKK